MNLLADESVEKQIVEQLRQDGHDVLYITEMEPGISDDVVLERANAQNALLMTADKDFGELVFHQNLLSAGGVALIRLAGLSAVQKAMIVGSVFLNRQSELLNAFTVISPGNVRIRPK